MASLIELAAQRLEQLRRAGIDVPEPRPADAPAESETLRQSAAAASGATDTATLQPAAALVPQRHVVAPPTPASQSRRVDLNLDQIAAAGVITPSSPRNLLADQYRVIKRPLIANATGRGASAVRHANLIMVTSALSGEGKSFTSINLAMSIAAELDHTVLLVDADVARPSVLRVLGQPPAPGLLDVLQRKIGLHNAILRTNVEKLSLLPSGTPQAHATELLASDAMTALIDEIASRYTDRIIIFDSPPLLLTTEARVLATHMGQIVMVVRADHTLQSSVEQALTTIEHCPVKMLLLNQVRGAVGGSGYGAGGGYAYSYGYGYTDSKSQGASSAQA